jgi:hypothetical protein
MIVALRLSPAKFLVELFLQLVIELNPVDLATLPLDLIGGLVIQAVEIGVVVCFPGLHKARVEGLILGCEPVSTNQAPPLLGECEDLLRLLLEDISLPSFDKPLLDEAAKITVEARAVAGVGMLGEILDSHHTELADFREGVNFRWAERIASAAVQVFRAITFPESRKLPGLSRARRAVRLGAFATLGTARIGPGFGFAELFESSLDADRLGRAAASSSTGFPARAVTLGLPAGIAKIIDLESVKASRHKHRSLALRGGTSRPRL